jgi:sigma-E factor negative regulatory protein RseB
LNSLFSNRGPAVVMVPLLVAGLISLPSLAHAGEAPSTAATPQQVKGWLQRINDAARYRNFQGTFVVSSQGAVSSARIAHFCDGKNQVERIESLDGQARSVYRHNGLVHTLWPTRKVALVERREFLSAFPAMFKGDDDRITDFYEVSAREVDRVAGHEVNVLVIQPKDPYRFGYRLFAERNTGLLLRADVLDLKQQVIETSAFSDVVIGVKSQADQVLQGMKRLDGYRVVTPELTSTRLEDHGWEMKSTVPGFRQVSCVSRPMDGGAPGATAEPPGQVLQAIYSDGLTHVSVFVEPYAAKRHHKPASGAVGATRMLTRQHDEWWLTVVGDVPMATLRQFADGITRMK